jgi:hypothetical protein
MNDTSASVFTTAKYTPTSSEGAELLQHQHVGVGQ